MLTVAQDLQNLIAPYQSAVNTALSVATSLPLVGHQLTALQDLRACLQIRVLHVASRRDMRLIMVISIIASLLSGLRS